MTAFLVLSYKRMGESFPDMKAETKVPSVYFLYGPEVYLVEQEVQRLLDLTLPEKERGLNLHIFAGEDHHAQVIAQAAQTLPMFSRYRFVLVRGADGIDEKEMGPLLKYIQDPSPSTCLVLSAQTLGPWKGHRTQLERVGKVVEYSRLKGKALISWIKTKMKERGKTLAQGGAEYLVEVVGDHLHPLENALEQVCLGVGEKNTVELSDIEGTVSEVKISTVFDLTEAIGRQDVEKALGILGKALESKAIPFKKEEEASKMGDPVPLLLSMMARQYRLIWRVKKMASSRVGMEETTKALRMSPWMVKNLVEQGKSFSESSLREGILRCHRTDLSIKKGRGPKDLLMEKLVIDLCRPTVT
jgi:DNA polymerase III subunit delta